MKMSYIRKNFTQRFFEKELQYSELDYLNSCGLCAVPYTKDSMLIWNEHYGFAEELLEWKKNPATKPYKKKKLLPNR